MPTSASPTRRTWLPAGDAGRAWPRSPIAPLLAGRGAAEPPSDRYALVAHGADGATYDLGSWQLTPGRKVIFTSGTALTGTQIKNLQITQPNGPAILTLGAARLFRTADR
jgi:hypothetical protein